ncbi:MAG: hypothetical protein WCO56_24600 [Verrucomicrobiota bacterium]
MKTLSPYAMTFFTHAVRAAAMIVSITLLGGWPAGLRAETPARGLKICVAADAPEPVRRAADAMVAAAKTHPLLAAMCGAAMPTLADTKTLVAGKPEVRALDHLVIIGLPDDPLIRAAWQREARAEDGGLYIFGFGHLRGDIGYIESDRNPFLHGRFIPRAPYETEVVTITGTTPAGVALAADAFLKQSLVNGVVAAPGWKRPATTLLDRDPLPPGFAAPAWLPAQIQQARRMGWAQAGEDEYRGVLADAGVSPKEIWRAKYLMPGAWDGAGADKAYEHYLGGLHRRAYGNTVWCARFESAAQATQAAPKIASAAKLQKAGAVWKGTQPPAGFQKESSGPLTLWLHGEWVILTTLSEAAATELQAKLRYLP